MSETTSSSKETSLWSSPAFIWSAIAMAVIVVIAIIVALSSGGREEMLPAAQPTAAVPASTSDSVCGLQAGDQSIPTTAAPESTWVLVGKVAAPSDPEYGPGVDDDGIASCFAQSPIGALYATAHIYAEGAHPDLSRRAVETRIAPGPGRAAAIEDFVDSAGKTDVSVQFAGFQILGYDGNTATVDIVARASNGAILSFVTQLAWVDGDWYMVVQSNGQAAVPPRQIEDLTGYVRWSGA